MTNNDTTNAMRELSASEMSEVSGGLAPLFIAMGIGAAGGVIAGILTAGDPLGPWLKRVIRENS